MPDSELFRKEAIAHRGKIEPLNGLLRVTAPHEGFIVLGLVGALLAVLLWAFLGRVDRTLAIGCVLAHPGDRHMVVATETGSIVDVLTDVGEVVEEGQPLARVGAPDLGEQFIVSPFAGTITSHSLTLGQAVTSGTPVARVLRGAASPLEPIAYVTSDTARRLQAGMEAAITPGTPGGSVQQPLAGVVTFVASRQSPPPHWLTDFGVDAPSRSHLVRMSLAEPSSLTQPSPRDGDYCSARIVVGSDPPIRLINALGAG